MPKCKNWVFPHSSLPRFPLFFTCKEFVNLFVFWLTGNWGVVQEGLNHLAIPCGWGWGGVVSNHCPIYCDLYSQCDFESGQAGALQPTENFGEVLAWDEWFCTQQKSEVRLCFCQRKFILCKCHVKKIPVYQVSMLLSLTTHFLLCITCIVDWHSISRSEGCLLIWTLSLQGYRFYVHYSKGQIWFHLWL